MPITAKRRYGCVRYVQERRKEANVTMYDRALLTFWQRLYCLVFFSRRIILKCRQNQSSQKMCEFNRKINDALKSLFLTLYSFHVNVTNVIILYC